MVLWGMRLSVVLVLLLLVVCTWLHIALLIVVHAARVIYGLWFFVACNAAYCIIHIFSNTYISQDRPCQSLRLIRNSPYIYNYIYIYMIC